MQLFVQRWMLRHVVETCMTSISCFAKQNAIFLSPHYIHTGDAPRNHRPFNSGNMMVSRGFWWHVQVMVSICGSSSPSILMLIRFGMRESPHFFCQMSRVEENMQPEAFNNWKYSKPTHLEMGGRWIKLHEPSPVPLEHLEAGNISWLQMSLRIFTQMGVVETKLFIELPAMCFRVLIPVDFQSNPIEIHWTFGRRTRFRAHICHVWQLLCQHLAPESLGLKYLGSVGVPRKGCKHKGLRKVPLPHAQTCILTRQILYNDCIYYFFLCSIFFFGVE